jgi:hypothetical protein
LESKDRIAIVVIILCAVLIDSLIADPGRARAAAVCGMVFGYTIWSRRRLRRRVWFWVALLLLAASHVVLISFVRWTNDWMPPQALLGVALIDLAYVCGPIWLIEEALSRESKIS